MTRFPKSPGDGRYRVEMGRPGDRTDVILDYTDELTEARAAMAGAARRKDGCRGIITDVREHKELEYKANASCKDCGKCPGLVVALT